MASASQIYFTMQLILIWSDPDIDEAPPSAHPFSDETLAA